MPPFRKHLFRSIGHCGLPLLAFAGPAAAADISEAELMSLVPLSLAELINLPVTTASRHAETRDHTPAHIMVVTRAQIRERRYKNLADLLEDMPGIDFMRGSKSSQYNQFTVQGYTGPNKVLFMLDGVRIGHPAGGNIPVAENLSLHLAKQVEILYGPAAALYGADAVAGVVNIITAPAAEEQGGWISIGGGEFGSREASFIGGVSTHSGLAFSLGGHWQESDRAPLQDFYPDEFAKVDAKTFAGQTVVPAGEREDYIGEIGSKSLFARLDLNASLSLGIYRNVFHSLTSTGDPPATAIYLKDSRWTTTTDTVYGKYRFDLAPDLSGELVLDYSNMEVDPDSKYHNIYNGFTDGYSYVRGRRASIEQNLNWRLSDRHRVQGGIGYQDYYAIETASLPAPYDTDKDTDKQGFLYPNTDLPMRILDSAFTNISAYAQIQSAWDGGFSTMAGLRLDQHSEYGQSINPRLGGAWRVNESNLLKALYGESFRAPSPEESLSSFGTFDGSQNEDGLYVGTGFRVPNFNLEPEEAKTLSLTWDWRPRPSLNLIVNAYHSEIENLVVTQASPDTDAIPGAILIRPETKGNAGTQTQSGVDVIGQWRYRLSHAWSGDLWGSYSWIDGHIDEGDGVEWDLSHVSTHKVKLGTTLRYRDTWSITPKLLWIDEANNGRKDRGNPPDRLTTPGYTLVNLHIGRHKLFDTRSSLWLDVYNLFDKRYYAAGGAGSRTFYDIPQQPRTVMLAFEHRF